MDRFSIRRLVDKMSKIKVYCTDKEKFVDADILNVREKQFVEVAMNTVKVRLNYNKNDYVGSMAGLEFVLKEDQLPKDFQEYVR
jgi:hypothetical protein